MAARVCRAGKPGAVQAQRNAGALEVSMGRSVCLAKIRPVLSFSLVDLVIRCVCPSGKGRGGSGEASPSASKRSVKVPR